MTPKYLERTKRKVSVVFASVAFVGLVLVWIQIRHPEKPDLGMPEISLLLISSSAFFGGMPGDFDSLKESKIWLIAGYCALPLLLTILLLKPWTQLFQ